MRAKAIVDRTRSWLFSRRRSAGVGLAALALVCVVLASDLTQAGDPPLPAVSPELQALQARLQKYRDPVLAIHDGYFSTLGCIEYPDGSMGIHFLNPNLLGPVPDPLSPQILLYEPDEKAFLHLVGVEWLIPLATGIEGRPSLFGQAFEGPMEGHQPLLPKELHHYDLHAWIFKENPSGVFSHSNPNVSCAGWRYTFNEVPPPLVPHD